MRHVTSLIPPVKYFYWPFQGGASFADHLRYLCLVLLYFRARMFIDALWSPAWKGLTSWPSFVMSNCEVVTFPLVSWVRCGAWLYRFLIFGFFLTFILYALWKCKYCVYEYLHSLNLHSQIDWYIFAQTLSSHLELRPVSTKQFSAVPPSAPSGDKTRGHILTLTCENS